MIRLLRDPLDAFAVNVPAAGSQTRRIRTFNAGAGPMILRVLLLALIAAPAAAQVPAADSAWLVATTQSLLDGVTNGDTAVWSRHLAPDWIQATEEGEVVDRAAFLADLRGLPPGQQGRLSVTRRRLTGDSTVAVLSYDADEWHDFYGQELRTVFHITDTWVRSGGRWRQLASQVTALPRPVEGKPVSPRVAREYAGRYALTPELRLTIAATDSGLVMTRQGGSTQRLYALDVRLFVRHGVRGFWLFERDSTGKVTRLVNWRDNNAVVWRRER